MPASEEDIANTERCYLKEELMRLGINLSTLDDNKIKSWDQNNIVIQLSHEKIGERSNFSIEIDNRQIYKKNENSDDKEKECIEKVGKDADSKKCDIEKIVNEIYKMGPQVRKDVMNYLKQRFHSKEPWQGPDRKTFDSLDKSVRDETKCVSCSDGSEVQNHNNDDDMTAVKKAFSNQEMVYDNSSNPSDDNSHKDPKSGNTWSLIETQQINKLNYLQYNNNTSENVMEIVEDDLQFVMENITDEMESQKNKSDNENRMKIIVQEKQDFENAEKYIFEVEQAENQDLEHADKTNLEIGLGENPYFHSMLDSDPFSDISVEPISLPNLYSSVFLPGAGETILETCYPQPTSLDSFTSSRNNRLSLEWGINHRNVCYPCNIIASRQTNTLCLSSYMLFSSKDEGPSFLPEGKFFPIERKTCNLMTFSDSLGVNVCGFSFSNKCVSKEVVELKDKQDDVYYSKFEDSKECASSLDSLKKKISQGCYRQELEGDSEDGEESLECISEQMDLKKEAEDDNILSWELNIENMKEEDGESYVSYGKVESAKSSYYFGSLVKSIDLKIREDKPEEIESSHDRSNHLEITYEHADIQTDNVNQTIGHEKELNNVGDSKNILEKNTGERGPMDYAWEKSPFDDSLKYDWNQDAEENLQENCQRASWNGNLKDLFSIASDKKDKKRRQRSSPKKELKRDKKEFKKKLKCDVRNITLFQNKSKGSEKKRKQRKQTNNVKFKSQKSSGCPILNCIGKKRNDQKNTTKKEQSTHPIKNNEGDFHRFTEDPPVRLNWVQAKVCSRSGGESGHNNSGRGSANGAHGNRNVNSNRETGNSGQSGNGNGSNSDGNENNNNGRRNNLSGNNTSQRDDNTDNKPKKAGNKISADDSGPVTDDPIGMNINLTENQIFSPSLPPPRLDPKHVAERRRVEDARKIPDTDPLQACPPGLMLVPGQNEGFVASGSSEVALSGVQTFLPEGEEAPVKQHAAISLDQLCDAIGDATHSVPPGVGIFKILNMCMTFLAHNLEQATNDDSCNNCLVLSQLFKHVADPEHDGFGMSCDQCSQIFNLLMLHCISCIETGRQRSRFTQSDLCYKICKYAMWKVDLLNCSVNRLKSKVQKYCDKVLGSIANMIPLGYLEGEGIQVMSEMGVATFPEATSTNLSSSATLSLNGNIVTTETGEQESTPTHQEELPFTSGPTNVLFVNQPASTATTSITVVPPCSGPAASCGNESSGHMRLTRKPSQPRKQPAIPPPIVEETQPLEQGTTENDNQRDDIENIIYQRFGSKNDDPYETTKTYGQSTRYGSLPLGNVHDVEQFFSVSTQPQGMPGIGEVVIGYPSQLRIVARYWDKKREECERTRYCPYQHREEGVILADQKENFRILHTRYQKHNQWEKVSHLGNGMSGKCHLAIDLKTNFKFCCKKIHLLRYAEEELTLWSEMHSPYVVRLYGAIRHGVKIYIFSEFIDGGSLATCIEEQKRLGRRLSHWSAINYFRQLLIVLAFLQSKNILHEDIKADNILLRRNSTLLAVTDFGTSRRLQDPKELKNKSPVGSPTHWSPEKASMEGHGFPADLWAAVCVLVHMLSGEPPWVKRFMKNAAILNYVIYTRSPPMEDVPNNVELVVRNLIERGFVKDPQARPSPSELLRDQAFSILDNGTPETYYSTLASVAHSGLPAVPRSVPSSSEQQDLKKDDPAPNTLDLVPAGASVLFETNVTTGPYQESDSRPDHKNQNSHEKVQEKADDRNNTDIKRQTENKNYENYLGKIKSNTYSDGQTVCLPETPANTSASITQNNLVSNEDDITASASKMNFKVHQLLAPLDINKLLPQFSELLVSGDSINNQSIMSFFADSYSTNELNETKQPGLQEYKPEERGDEIPNLSIFETSWEASSEINRNEKKGTPSLIPENKNASSNPTRGVNFPYKNRIFRSPHPSPPHAEFMLSSESDDCTSAELFELETTARNPDSVLNTSGGMDTQAMKESSLKHSVYQSGEVSPTASSSSTFSSSGTSNLQQRKPLNLTLNVACNTIPSGLSHSQSYTQTSSATSTSEIEQKQRASTWSNISSSTHTLNQSGSTPSSSHASSVHRKANGTGTSIPSTASSGHSQFSYRPSVSAEQERLILELSTDFSPTSSESDKLSFAEGQQPEAITHEDSEHEGTTDMKILLDAIDETKLAGHNLKFYDENKDYLFTMRLEEWPSDWKRLIASVRHKIQHSGYSHFSIHHMDNKLVKFYHPLSARDFKVVHRQDAKAECWCQHCQTMY